MFATSQGWRAWIAIACLTHVGSGAAQAAAPTLFSQMADASPVRGEPGDLLLLAGYGFASTDTVVYAAIVDTTAPLRHPDCVPSTSTAASGVLPVASAANVPDSLAVSLPAVLLSGHSYAIWVRNSNAEWSNGVRINDARPLWISPDSVYATDQAVSLPRYLKVIGRNLNAVPGVATQVRLAGPTSYTLEALDDGDPATAIETYVANVTLPETLLAGEYNVSISRDGVSWVPLSGQSLSVLPDPAPLASFPVDAFGCAADDDLDDTVCIVAAIAAARNNGGGTVTFGPGVWDMNFTGVLSTVAPVTWDGVLVPVGVNLQGAGAGLTILQRGTGWPAPQPNFALQGNNTISGIGFRDANVYSSDSVATLPGPVLRLGVTWYFAHLYHSTDPTSVSGVVISHNVFDRPFVAITDGGLPIDHLVVTYNEFGAYANDIAINGDGGNVHQKFHLDDSIFAFNTFKPGSYMNTAIGQGVIATGLAAAQRVDFSGNVADGTATQYLYDPETDPKGWRAAFFWAMRGNIEKLLVAQNAATCTGDKDGDGESFAYDGNHNTFALSAAQPVLAATSNTVTIPGPLAMQQGVIQVPGDFYSEHWVQIAAGPGKGQARKIVSYPLDSAGAPLTPVTFTVAPAWDVLPQASSTVVVARVYWQVYTVDNFVDQRQPLCNKGNLNKPSGGIITLYGQTADSAVEGNRQYDTSGILLANGYTVADPANSLLASATFQTFVDIRGNTIDGEYQYLSDCSWSGVQAWFGAGLTAGSAPPAEGYGISISHNFITHADGLRGGAIALTPSWHEGPPGINTDLIESTLIFANTINNVGGPAAAAAIPYASCATGNPRLGINVVDRHVFHTVLAANTCKNVTRSLSDVGTGTQRVCSVPLSDSCECPP